jgi:hypothetical protein
MRSEEQVRPAGTEDLLGQSDRDEHYDDRHYEDRLTDNERAERAVDEGRFGGGPDVRTYEQTDDHDAFDGDGELPESVRMADEGGPVDPAPPADTPDTTASATQADSGIEDATLFGRNDAEDLQARWMQVQASFVDEPRSAVQQADQLVAEVMQAMAATLASTKQGLEGQWQREGTADTEDLRQALRQYRTFFDKLLHA